MTPTKSRQKGKPRAPRSDNFTLGEEATFTSLLPDFSSRIECKHQSAKSRDEKAKAWEELVVAFNSLTTGIPRTEKNLRNLWDKLKKRARKANTDDNEETFKTGVGSKDKSVEPKKVDDVVLGVLGPSGQGMSNGCDGDSVALCDPIVLSATTSSNEIQNTNDLPVANGVQDIMAIDFASIVVQNGDQQNIGQITREQNSSQQSEDECQSWAPSNIVPRMLYNTKPDALRANSSSSKRRDPIAAKMERAKMFKRRRPKLPHDETQSKLALAKIQLAEATKKTVEEENKRNEQLFEIEIEKKKYEAELAKLNVLKLERDLNLE